MQDKDLTRDDGLIIDIFAGGGGASVGIEMALGRQVDIAVNHDPQAILMHKTNHPNTLHLTEDVFKVNLRKYTKGKHVALMWASPDCTSHSKAKGGQPRKSGLRVLPWAVFKHVKQIKPDVIVMENVEEIQQWGPLDDNGRPIKEKMGEDYRKFINAMKSLGYVFDSRELVAANYGVPTTRKRWYAIFRNDGKPIVWPEQTHFKDHNPKWLECGDYVDWSDLGKSIFDRKKPLAEKTQARIAFGIRKFILENPEPYVVKDNRALAFMIQYHSETKNKDARGNDLSMPIKTLDTSNRYGLVTAFITKFYKTGAGQQCTMPLHTITTSAGHFGVVSAYMIKFYSNPETNNQPVNRPLGYHNNITTADRFGLVSTFLQKYYGDENLGVLVEINGEKYVIADIFLRMLNPEELKVMQGFPKDYIIDRDYRWKRYPKTEQVKRIGNSVVPIMAKVIISANCSYLKAGERKPNPIIFTEIYGQVAFG